MTNLKNIRVALLCSATAVAALSSSQAFAAGFEKALFWDAHYSGIAGAAQSSVTGPQAVFWNPAGLSGTEGMQVNGDFSPTLAKFNGSVPNTGNVLAAATGNPALGNAAGPYNSAVSSSTGFDPVGAVFASYQVNDKITAGIGYYVVGGTKANYSDVSSALNYPGNAISPFPLEGNLAITELGLGAGYEVLPGLKVGASYRITFFKADLDDAFISNAQTGQISSLQYSGLAKTTFNGFKLGAMWEPKDANYGFGLTWRSRVNATATTSNATLVQATPLNPTATTTTGNGSAGLNLPMRIDAAAHYTFIPNWTGFLGYSFTNLSQDQQIGEEFDGGAGLVNNIPLNWTNQHNIRVALEYTGMQDWMFRGGYVWTNQVTPDGAALPILAAPGTGNTFVVGAGHKFSSMLTADAAFEYDRDSGTLAATDVPNTGGVPTSRTTAGDYSAKDYVLHLSATLSL
jgi:long-subunit fatty acid transport protein